MTARGSEANFANRVREGLQSGVIDLRIDTVRANRPGSPVYRPMWQAAALLLFVSSAVVVFLGYATWWFIAYLGVEAVVWIKFVVPFVRHKVADDVAHLIATDDQSFAEMWRQGLLGLVHVESQEQIYSPDGDWKRFVADKILRRQPGG